MSDLGCSVSTMKRSSRCRFSYQSAAASAMFHEQDAVRQVPAVPQGHQALVLYYVEGAEVLVLLHQPRLAGADHHPFDL